MCNNRFYHYVSLQCANKNRECFECIALLNPCKILQVVRQSLIGFVIEGNQGGKRSDDLHKDRAGPATASGRVESPPRKSSPAVADGLVQEGVKS